MVRLPDWELRLSQFMADHASRPFEWGAWDCALFATACAAEVTGVDRATSFRAAGYRDSVGAAKALRKYGKGTLEKTLDDLFAPKPVPFAHRGDIVMAHGATGVCMGDVGMFVGEEVLAGKLGIEPRIGLVTIDRAQWELAWSV